ncbi:MAG: acyl-CoA/acyl-ACP dehydrogenase [Dehalococcoidia bacterium]|nr:acyl-CoA/acyl-ACP dehydrogenase [Dehalococcoidia bacterium]
MTTTVAEPVLLRDETLHQALRAYVGSRAQQVDGCEVTLREGIAHISSMGVGDLGVYERDTPDQFSQMCEVLGTLSLDCMSQAFAMWCHRMATEYVHQADADSPVRERFLAGLTAGEILGSTSFAAATANYLAGTPLTLTFRRTADGMVLNGRIAWASNLQPPFVSIGAAANEDDPQDRVIFAFTEATPGLRLPAYPELLALQATSSTSPVFEDAVITDADILTRDFDRFVGRVLPTFLLLQSSFCWGLSTRALSEAGALLDGPREILAPAYEDLRARFESASGRLREYAGHPHREDLEHRPLLQLRLDFGRLTVEAVSLESKLAGGRGYMLHSGTARRLREAAFLPVQAPTEVQLQWLLARSA